MDAIKVTYLSILARRGLARVHVIALMACVAAWLGLLIVLGLSAAGVNQTALSEPALLGFDYRWQAAATIALAMLQGLLIVTLLLERRARLRAQAETSENQTELMHTSRLAVLGQLSAYIAHEINQPLGAILSNAEAAELLLAQADPDLDEVRLILADVRKDGLRASEVVRQVRSLAHKRHPEFMDVDLQELSRDILHLVDPIAARRGVAILTDFESEAIKVHGDPILLRQAMLNLLLNAIDALDNVPKSQAMIEVRMTSPQPGEAEVAVRDYGNGVPGTQLDRLFEAFFTTKTHGMGLGLAIVRSIIESHDGRILAENHPDGGAVFRFTLPTVDVAGTTNPSAGEPV
ncbi:MAG: ATP-binding protein [Onishia taeanensis]|uniref:sensor histidine kinase n=1 Tax=Onishia taeanensis TaxID=284577 RepID=UPI003C7BE682